MGPRRTQPWVGYAMYGLVALVLVIAYVTMSGDARFDRPGGLVVGMWLAGGFLLLVDALARRQTDPVVARIIRVSGVAKLGAIAARFLVAYVAYDGAADADRYFRVASSEYPRIRALDLSALPSLPDDLGTPMMEFLTSVVFAGIGPSRVGGFVAFGVLAWLGQWTFLRMAQVGFPDLGDPRLFAALVMLTPSMLYWPASIGKESVMLLAIGMTSLAVVRLLQNGDLSTPLFVGGLTLASAVRPHIGLMLTAASGLGLLVGRASVRRLSFGARAVGLGVVLFAAAVVTSQVQEFLDVDTLSPATISAEFNEVVERTSTGGSQFENVQVTNPFLLPVALVSVLFRPFPFEAGSLAALVLSFESLGLMALLVRRRRSVVNFFRDVWRSPSAMYVLAYLVLFVLLFSNFSNLGLLARERVQGYPFLMLMLAWAPGRDRSAAASAPPVVVPSRAGR